MHWDRLLFSAKESVYKAWFPLTGRWLGFQDAMVTVDPSRGTLCASLLVPGPILDGNYVERLDGRFAVTRDLILTAVWKSAG